jgi:polysaccharide biosynthesis transport protein
MQPSDTHQMESTQPRHLDEGATVSLDQLANRSGMMMPSTRRGTRLRPPPALNPSATALLRVLRYRWLLALGLGLAAALVVAAITWILVPRPKDYYDARALLLVAQRAGGPGGYRDPVDFQTYRRTQTALAKSLSVARAALERPEAKKLLQDHKLNLDKTAREIQKGITVDSGPQEWPSQILPVTLQWPNAEESVVFVNAVTQQLVDEASRNENDDNRKRYEIVTTNYKDAQKGIENLNRNYHALLAKMAELTTDDEQQLKDEIRILNTTISNRDLEITNILNRNELEKQEQARQKAPTLVVTDQLVDDYVLRDAEIKGYLNEIDRANQYMAKLRIIAAVPESLPEYQEYVSIVNELNLKLLHRKAELRPLIRKKLDDISNIKAEPDYITEENLVISRRTLEKYRDQLRSKTGQLSKLAEARRKQELALSDQIDSTKTELEQRRNYAKKLLDEIDSLKGELNGTLARLRIEQAAIEAEKVVGKDANNAMRTVGLAAVGAFCLAALGVGWWEFRSRRIHSTDELAGQLGLRMIGTVPSLPDAVRRQPIPAPGQEMYWHSRLTEAVDSITTLLLHEASQVGARALLVTSAVGHEGKTTLACHLATSLARAGKRTLLIDGDLVHPTAHLMFNEGLEPGLSDLLRGQCNLPDVVRPTQASGLWMITAGQADSSVVQALARDAMQPLLEMLKSEYDFIIIDSSPVLPLAHALLIGKHVDAAVLAVRRDISRVMPVYAAHQRLATLGIPVLGAVFMEQNNPGYDSYTYSEGSIPGQNTAAPPAVV